MNRTSIRRPRRRTTRAGALAAPALVLGLLGASPALAADAPFKAAPDIELGAGSLPGPAAVADFNGDGAGDLAVAGYRPADKTSISILRGTGDGRFVTGTGWTVPTYKPVRSLAVGDFNGDARADFAGVTEQILAVRLGRAVDAAGNRSASRSAAFRIVR